MARPTEEVVLWAAQDVTLPSLAGPNKVLPISDLINKGWDMNQKPAADEFNYLLNNYAKWLVYLDEKSGGASPDAPEVDSLPSTTPLRDTDGKGCFKGIKASNTTNANSFNMIDTYNSKAAVSVSVDGNEIGNFVYNGLLASGDGKSGLACNTTGTHYGNVTGNVIGNTTGTHYGNVTGNVIGIHYGNVTGNVVGNVTGNTTGTHYGSVLGNVTGNADTATSAGKWTNERTINFTGDVYGSVTLDGTANKTVTLSVNSGLNYTDLYTGDTSTTSVNVGAGFTSGTAGIIHVYMKDYQTIGCGVLTASLLADLPSGQMQIDITNGDDFFITYSYTSSTGMLTITNGGKGSIFKIGKHY